MVTIILTDALKGKTMVLNRRYPFEDGKMVVEDDEDGAAIFKLLKKYYPVKASKKILDEIPDAVDHVPTSNQAAGDKGAAK